MIADLAQGRTGAAPFVTTRTPALPRGAIQRGLKGLKPMIWLLAPHVAVSQPAQFGVKQRIDCFKADSSPPSTLEEAP